MSSKTDPHLQAIMKHLKQHCKCHTALLYGSRARGEATATSDYDVLGVRSGGVKNRIVKKHKGCFWDVFVYPEAELRNLFKKQMDWTKTKVLFQKDQFGRDLIANLKKYSKKFYQPLPPYEIRALKVWSQKQIERCRNKDIFSLLRLAEFQASAVEHYFLVRRKRFLGAKQGLLWLKKNDPPTFKAIERVLKDPTDPALKAMAKKVYLIKSK